MTAGVGYVAQGKVDVDVRRQETGPLNPDEEGFFSAEEPATIREVCLSSQGVPLLIARTVFTSDILRTHPRIVELGNRPLGSLLFADGVTCPYSARQFTEIREDGVLFPLIRWRHQGAEVYWGRRTLFQLFGAPLLVTEIFTPELIQGAKAAMSSALAAR